VEFFLFETEKVAVMILRVMWARDVGEDYSAVQLL
jgi:hypothetical protein